MTDTAQKESLELMITSISENSEGLLEKSQVKVLEDQLSEEELKHIEQRAEEFLRYVSNKELSDIRNILENIVIEDIEELENSSQLLSAKIGHIVSIDDMESSNIAATLLKLNGEISNINPHKFNFNGSKLLNMIPFVGKPIDKYLKKFKSAQEVINEIISSLEEGELLLRDDNTVLQHDKQRYKEAAVRLQRKAMVMERAVQAIEANLAKLGEREREFYENNLLLNLQKKIRSVYEILVVTQEGFLSSDFVINTNWELIDNISNVKVVTKRALEIGVAMLVALENQKNVLNAVEQTKSVANELIVDNAKRLNHQASEIYAQAGTATLSIDTLKEAFAHIDEAMNKIDSFKSEALAKTREEISQLKVVTQQLDEKIKEAEKIEKTKIAISLDV